ncbi:MAG TPA: flagellar type III secretion system pore protein FliP [Chloroflexota bacterium]|nr:flagellar type III secretion system pore protein FliP [Chloroflexota bacterium]
MNIPSISVNLGHGNGGIGSAVQVLVLITLITLAPSLVIMLTSFTRIIVVLGFVRTAIGIPQTPPNQVLTGLALFLTFFIMSPTLQQINNSALQPLLANKISQQQALDRAQAPVRAFMFKQVRMADLALMVGLAHEKKPRTTADVPTLVLIPAFILSELHMAFQIGFMIFLPFLVIDIVVSSALMAMGMMMLPPTTISLPFKLLLFVMVDGWHLIVQSLVVGFH